MRLDLAQFRELQAFVQFASDLDESTRNQINRGRRLVEILKQDQYQPMSMSHQVAAVLAVNEGLFDNVPVSKVKEAENSLHQYLSQSGIELLSEIQKTGNLEDDIAKKLTVKMKSYLEKFYQDEKEEKE